MLKWNVNMSAYNNPWPSRIGGVLRDHGDKFLYIFFCSIVNMNSNETEVLAIQKIILLKILIAIMFFQIKGPLNLILTILLGLKEKTSCEHYHWIQWY